MNTLSKDERKIQAVREGITEARTQLPGKTIFDKIDHEIDRLQKLKGAIAGAGTLSLAVMPCSFEYPLGDLSLLQFHNAGSVEDAKAVAKKLGGGWVKEGGGKWRGVLKIEGHTAIDIVIHGAEGRAAAKEPETEPVNLD